MLKKKKTTKTTKTTGTTKKKKKKISVGSVLSNWTLIQINQQLELSCGVSEK